MNVFDMTKEDFEKVPGRGGWSRDIGEFNALVIIPQDYVHDSGWMCMDFVAVSKEGEPICRLSGCSDVLNLMGLVDMGNGEPTNTNFQTVSSRKVGVLTVFLAAICGYLAVVQWSQGQH